MTAAAVDGEYVAVHAAGSRRIDRVLGEGFLEGLRELPLTEVRSLRADAEQEEVDLSYLRRMVQGRIDVLRAELAHRFGDSGGESLVDALPHILADEPRSTAHGMGRYTSVEPSRADSHRRLVEALVADVDLSDAGARSDEEIDTILDRLDSAEAALSEKRHKVQEVMDACGAEITRRYRDGEASVGDLLADEGSGSSTGQAPAAERLPNA